MGSVWIATDDEGRRVAFKVVLQDIDDTLLAPQRFFREVASLNQLVHPTIIELLDFGRDEQRGLSYLVMELVEGDPVSRLTALGRCPPALVLEVARQTAQGLAVAHDAEIVHRDLKPGNLMLLPGPDRVQVKILDFGLAWMHADTKLTKTGTAPGTVAYMAPEQLRGEPVDGRTDLYALGVIMFEMLAGRKPFEGENQTEIAMSVLTGTAPRVDRLVSAVPAELGLLVHRLLMKRELRPASARALVDEIQSLQKALTMKPLRVAHTGPSRDPVSAWHLTGL